MTYILTDNWDWETVAVDKIDWYQSIHMFFDKPERMKALLHLKDIIPKDKLFELFAAVWIQAESHYKEVDTITQLLEFMGGDPDIFKTILMNDDDKKEFKKLGHVIAIYRGCWKANQEGYSWTINRSVAEKFAKRHAPDGQPLVVSGIANSADVIAYFTGREEQEIVIYPWKVTNIKVKKLPKQAINSSALIFQMVQAGNFFTPEQEKEKFLMLGRLQPDTAKKVIDEKLGFYKRFGFQTEYNFWNDIKLQLGAIYEK